MTAWPAACFLDFEVTPHLRVTKTATSALAFMGSCSFYLYGSGWPLRMPWTGFRFDFSTGSPTKEWMAWGPWSLQKALVYVILAYCLAGNNINSLACLACEEELLVCFSQRVAGGASIRQNTYCRGSALEHGGCG